MVITRICLLLQMQMNDTTIMSYVRKSSLSVEINSVFCCCDAFQMTQTMSKIILRSFAVHDAHMSADRHTGDIISK